MGGRRGRRQNRGGDLRYNLEITLEESFKGRNSQIKVPSAVACEACGGSGAEPGHKAEQCPTCSGIGKVRAQQGFFTIERTCPGCRGSGRVIKNPCKGCKGAGHVQKERTLSVDIPPGVEEGKGMPVLRGGGMHGDLHVEVVVETPVKLSKKQKELLKEFDKLNEEGCHPETESWLAKAKSFLGGDPKAKN